jgi:hypothetical protein
MTVTETKLLANFFLFPQLPLKKMAITVVMKMDV